MKGLYNIGESELSLAIDAKLQPILNKFAEIAGIIGLPTIQDQLASFSASLANKAAKSDLPLSPIQFGVKPDGDYVAKTGTDNTAAFQDALNAAVTSKRALVFPDGVFRFMGKVVPTGPVTLQLSPNTVLWFDNILTNFIEASDVVTIQGNGGKIRGSWDMAGQGTANVVNGRNNYNRLLSINIPANRYVDRITIDGVEFSRACGNAVEISQQGATLAAPRLGGITLSNCYFHDTYGGVLVNNFSDNEQIIQKNIRIVNTRFERTASTGANFTIGVGAENAGNAITIWGRTDGLLFQDVTIVDPGRMGIECFIGSEATSRNHFPINTVFDTIDISGAGYYNFSVAGHNTTVRNSKFTALNNPQNLEFEGNAVLYENCKFIGTAVSTTVNTPIDPFSRRGVIVRGCTFTDVAGQKEMISIVHAAYIEVGGNTFNVSNNWTGTGQRNPVLIQNAAKVLVHDNVANCSGQFITPIYNFGNLTDFIWRDDRINLTGYSDNQLQDLVNWGGINQGTIQNIKTTSTTTFGVAYGHFDGHNYSPGGLWKREMTSGGWVITALKSVDPQTAPPTTPAVDDAYLVRDNATGAWAGQGRKLATWNGTAWTFQTLTGAYVYHPTPGASPVVELNQMPEVATVGTVNLLFRGVVFSNVTIRNCDFSAGGKIVRNGNAVPQLGNAILFGLNLVQTNINTSDAKINDVVTLIQPLERSVSAGTSGLDQTTADGRYVRVGVAIDSLNLQLGKIINMDGQRWLNAYNENTNLGRYAGNLTTTGTDDTNVGRNAGQNQTTGSKNTNVGAGAGLSQTTASRNTYVGASAGVGNTTGSDNMYMGYQAGSVPAGGANNSTNVGIGTSAGINHVGDGNVFIGYDTGNHVAGSLNTALGAGAANMVNAAITALKCVFLGREAGRNIQANSTLTNNVYLGADSGNGEGTASNTFYIGSQSTPMTTKSYGPMQPARLRFTVPSGAGAPSTAVLSADGDAILWKDTTAGTVRWYYNNSGSIIASPAFVSLS